MLDRFKVRKDLDKDVFTTHYSPEHSVTDKKHVNQAGRNLCVLFPPWHGGKICDLLTRRLVLRNYAVAAYSFHDEILKPNIEHVRSSFIHIRDTVVKDLTEDIPRYNYEQVKLISLSLGGIALSMTANIFPYFDSAVIVPPSSSLARSLWHGIRTQRIRTSIEQSGHDLPYLEEAWIDLEPINHINAFAGKDVSLVVSSTDRVIPAVYQEEYLHAARLAGANLTVSRTRMGHYATIGSFCLYGDI